MVTLDGSRRKRYCFGVPKTARIDRLRQALAELCGIKADRLVIAELWQYKLHNVFEVSGVRGFFARCGGSDLFCWPLSLAGPVGGRGIRLDTLLLFPL